MKKATLKAFVINFTLSNDFNYEIETAFLALVRALKIQEMAACDKAENK